MEKGQFETGCSSAATHRLTQSSTTLNRRYVQRPTNIAIEEAAKAAVTVKRIADVAPAPSRLVNLGVHHAELEAALAAKPEEPAIIETPEPIDYGQVNPIIPTVYEFGTTPEPAAPTPQTPALPAPYDNTYYDAASMPAPTYAEPTPVEQPLSLAPTAMSAAPEPQPETLQPEIDTASLAMSIAADYAAANLSASTSEYGDHYENYAMSEPQPNELSTTNLDSVEAIAQAASKAIASIRSATQPGEVAEQVNSLKEFAENIRANNAAPEMRELSDTIDKFVKIAMKSTGIKEATAKKATTATVSLSSKATRAADKITKSSAKLMATKAPTTRKAPAARPNPALRSRTANNRTRTMRRTSSPEELKERAIQQALRSVASMDEDTKRRPAPHAAIRPRKKNRTKHFLIAFTCAATCVGAILYFISTNMPDISVRVAAMQTGMQAAYPAYIPRDYSLGDVLSEDGKITMCFNGPNGASFTLVEEKSSWDSSALLRNYVEEEWGDNYTTTHEQGITIYTSNSDAAWVNGGMLYKITSTANSLTKKQLRNIVVSI